MHKENTYKTRLAHIIQVRHDLMEIRYMPGVTMDMAGVKEIHEVRKRLFGDRPYANISIIPDDVTFERAITEQDHYAAERGVDPLLAWAVVACGAIAEFVASKYFSRFPQGFPVLTTQDEDEARAWIRAFLSPEKAA